ncbi:MAG: hypothetical protein M3O33_12810 [Cyanobacteriota bacterium]|nr:hypothetical protein [Cyanobacteriota bacterium]
MVVPAQSSKLPTLLLKHQGHLKREVCLENFVQFLVGYNAINYQLDDYFQAVVSN